MWWFQSPKIAFGEDTLEVLKDLKGEKAFIVTDKNIRSLAFFDLVSKYLVEAGMEVGIFDGVESEPSIENVQEGTKLLAEFAPDWIIGLGGGSCIFGEPSGYIETLVVLFGQNVFILTTCPL